MSSFIFKKFEEPPNPDRLCDGADRRLFFWDGGGTGGQADNWSTQTGEIDALFYQKLNDPGPGDQFNQVLSVDSQGRIVNYYTVGSTNVKPNARGARAVDLQMFRVANTQVASGVESALIGGRCNTASCFRSSVIGGECNTASGGCSTVVGGSCNNSTQAFSGVFSGTKNNSTGQRSSVIGGECNTASGGCSTVVGGECNTALDSRSSVISGECNTVMSGGFNSTILGGCNNQIKTSQSFILGGRGSTVETTAAQGGILGGCGNIAFCENSIVVGGQDNCSRGANSVVVGGSTNQVCNIYSIVGGGQNNTACGLRSGVLAGNQNCSLGSDSVVIGGSSNQTLSDFSVAIGGRNNTVAADRSVVIGGCGLSSCVVNSATVQRLHLRNGACGNGAEQASFLAVTQAFNPAADCFTTIQRTNCENNTIRVPASAPDGTIIFLHNTDDAAATFCLCTGCSFTNKPVNGIVSQPTDANALLISSRGAATIYKHGNCFSIIGWYNRFLVL